jgi:hypothetical protein
MNPERKIKQRRTYVSSEAARKGREAAAANSWEEQDSENPLFRVDEVMTLLELTPLELEKFKINKAQDLLNEEFPKAREPEVRMMAFINGVRIQLLNHPQPVEVSFSPNTLTPKDLLETTHFTLSEMQKREIPNAWEFFMMIRKVHEKMVGLLPKP